MDEAAAVFALHKKKDSKDLEALLHEMFSLHTDVFSLILAFIKRAGKTRHSPRSLSRRALTAFQQWLKKDIQEETSGAIRK